MKAKAGLNLILAVAVFAIVSIWALPSVKHGQGGQDNSQQQGTISSKESWKGDDDSRRREERDDDRRR
ncbi:MAG: hypothetical protein WKF84_25365 [Pyrinomonadaceae bacterium]